jgi:hypothetical protein
VRRERRLLMRMDTRMLKDLGLSDTAHREASRPFWDLPTDRLAAETSRRGGGLGI